MPSGLDSGTPSPTQETEQQSENLLHGRQYASCFHAGGLSCETFIHYVNYINHSSSPGPAATFKFLISGGDSTYLWVLIHVLGHS